jgi:hypothetical protein
MSDEKRESVRVEILGALHGEVMVYQPMTVRQISRRGAQVETGFPLQVDSLHDLRLKLGPHAIVVKGRVAHSRISDVDQDQVFYRSGIEFVDPPERVISVIDQFVATIRQERQST